MAAGTDAAADKVEAAVRARLAPPAGFPERVARVRDALVARAIEAARARSSPLVRALVAGSAARGTYLADRLDIDLFLLFPPELPRDRLREEGMAIGRSILADTETKYAEHPYLRGTFEGFRVDAVPGFAVSDPARPLSAVDRTPFHQAWLLRHETPALVEEVRLAKQFLRALGIYGSEVRTEGLSGYTVELLVVRFGSLRGLLRAAQQWRIPVRLGEPSKDPPRLPDDVAMILADPVDPNRNVSSALSRRNLGTLVVAARQYLAAPSERWFEVRPAAPLTVAAAEARRHARGSHVVVVELGRPELVDDTLYPQLRKAERAVADEVARGGFDLLGSASAADRERLVIALEVAHPHRAGVRVRDGPPAGIDRVGEFLAKWTDPAAPVLQGPYVRPDGSVGVETREEERSVEGFVRERLPKLSLGRDLPPAPAAVAALAQARPSDALGEALRDLLAKRLPWLEPAPGPTTSSD
ncbi:MAG TPA: CCA tRNA nucleotidyltransferase [Thermoplasmata archaeon]|nr:CCA tRNA nucleotidyltransferase [Thermoplasmata archaeon]